MSITLTQKQASLAALLAKIAYVEQVARPPSRRDPELPPLADIRNLIETLESP